MGNEVFTMDQAIIWARDTVVAGLAKAAGIPVRLSDEQDPEEEPPYAYYSMITPYVPTGEYGNHVRQAVKIPGAKETYIRDIREENPEMSLSFTFCSRNRTADDGTEINGETEALQLAARGAAWFLNEGGTSLSAAGLAVLRVGSFASRSGILADEYVRRWGFDAAIRYKALSVRYDGRIERVHLKQGRSGNA